jgi:hypothetical protein
MNSMSGLCAPVGKTVSEVCGGLDPTVQAGDPTHTLAVGLGVTAIALIVALFEDQPPF